MVRNEYDANRHLACSGRGLSCTRWRDRPAARFNILPVLIVVGVLVALGASL